MGYRLPSFGLLFAALVAACSEDAALVGNVGEDGLAVNGTCAPHGELFTDHYTCEKVEGPSETSRADEGPSVKVVLADPSRLDDPDIAWVYEEVRSCSCVCCHNDDGIGAYVWTHEMEPFFLDGVSDARLGRFTLPAPEGAPVIDPDDNYGFTRVGTGWPMTDPDRFRAFIDRERARRGL